MAKIHGKLPKKSAKPTRLTVLLSACVIVLLSYFVIKTIRHKHKNEITNHVLSLPKLPEQKIESSNEDDSEWQTVTARRGDTLASIFKRLNLSTQTLQTVLHDNPRAKALSSIHAGQPIELLIDQDTLEKLIIPVSKTEFLLVYREGKHYKTKLNTHKLDSHNQYITATVRGSLYGTAQRLKIPYKLIRQMTQIFHRELDFAKDIRSGDQFTILYKAYYIENNLVNTGDILAVTYNNQGKIHQAIRHDSANGYFDYYSPEGHSFKKAFDRYPLKFSHISSTYSLSRKHPILHYNRPHRGIDLAASIGTPIRATGDGRVISIGHHSGYGNMIKIEHDHTYSSIYAHMLKFQKGLSRGDRVKRGQVIGYVGQTGLASGPHCHYELHINHQPRNPTTAILPHAAPIPTREMTAFKNKAITLLAQMKLYEEATLAAAKRKRAVV